MMRYSVQPRDWIFVKSYGYLPFVKNMSRNIGKNLMKNLSGKYSKKLIHYAKQFATNAFKTASKRAIQETGEESGDVIGNIAKLQKFQKLRNKIIQTQLQMSIIKKYLKKDIHISKRKSQKYWWAEIKIKLKFQKIQRQLQMKMIKIDHVRSIIVV